MTRVHDHLQPEHIDELVSFHPRIEGDTSGLMPRGRVTGMLVDRYERSRANRFVRRE